MCAVIYHKMVSITIMELGNGKIRQQLHIVHGNYLSHLHHLLASRDTVITYLPPNQTSYHLHCSACIQGFSYATRVPR